MRSQLRRLARPITALFAAIVATLALLASTFVSDARGASDGSQVSGTFAFSGSVLIGCPTGALLCTHGSFSGGLQGDFSLTLLTTVPSADLGVNYFTGQLVMKSDVGNLTCTLDGALDSRSSSEGEFGEICVIKSGTGRYAHARGDLRMIGTSKSVLLVPTGGGQFQATIATS